MIENIHPDRYLFSGFILSSTRQMTRQSQQNMMLLVMALAVLGLGTARPLAPLIKSNNDHVLAKYEVREACVEHQGDISSKYAWFVAPRISWCQYLGAREVKQDNRITRKNFLAFDIQAKLFLKESPSVVLGMGEILILAWSTCTYNWFSINSFASYQQ